MGIPFDLATGMLTAAEAIPFLDAAAGGRDQLLDPPLLSGSLWQARFPSYFVMDTLAKQQLLHEFGYGWDYSPDVRLQYRSKLFIVLVINATNQLLTCSKQAITYATLFAQPTGPVLDPSTRKVGPVANAVPAAEDGHPGFAAWVAGKNRWYGVTNFGLAFDPFPFALGCWSDGSDGGPYRISLLSTADAAQAQVDALNNQNSGYQLSTSAGGVNVQASVLSRDDTRAYIVVVSVTPA